MGASSSTEEISRKLQTSLAYLGLGICLAGFILISVQNVNAPLGWTQLFQRMTIGIANSLTCLAILLFTKRRIVSFVLIGISLVLSISYLIFIR
jgi:hypothetical protein